MRKYSIVINYINNSYALVLRSWEVSETGEQVNVESVIKADLTLEQAMTEAQTFINGDV